MEHVIQKIVEIEMKAQALIENAKREQDELPQKISDALEKKRKEYMEKATAHIEHIKEEEAKFADERIAFMKKEHEEKLEKLKKLTENNISALIDKVYEYIIKPTDLTL